MPLRKTKRTQRTTRSWKLNMQWIKESSKGLSNRLDMTGESILEDKIEEVSQHFEERTETWNRKEKVTRGRQLQRPKAHLLKGSSRDNGKWSSKEGKRFGWNKNLRLQIKGSQERWSLKYSTLIPTIKKKSSERKGDHLKSIQRGKPGYIQNNDSE